ncbi:hypothetical protein EB796_012547 [Bugula neritina]|uniref:Uncharacterized protein n=1 Tax=Bugula neritina TaxID=10212 RepID=A0A7J7JS35_BUGNE|nr:hypothetical protein EB796_012547 [Bugula neritina]
MLISRRSHFQKARHVTLSQDVETAVVIQLGVLHFYHFFRCSLNADLVVFFVSKVLSVIQKGCLKQELKYHFCISDNLYHNLQSKWLFWIYKESAYGHCALLSSVSAKQQLCLEFCEI